MQCTKAPTVVAVLELVEIKNVLFCVQNRRGQLSNADKTLS